MGFSSPAAYEEAAAAVVVSDDFDSWTRPDFSEIYYNWRTNEFVAVSASGHLLTYFEPEDGAQYWLNEITKHG
jgi:hypothetical protein